MVHVVIPRGSYPKKSNLCTCTSQQEAAKHFCRICHSEVHPKHSTALFSDVHMIASTLAFSVTFVSVDGLPAVPV